MVVVLCTALALAGPYEDGVEALKQGDRVAARSLLLQAIELDPQAIAPRWELGWTCWVDEDFACTTRAWTKVAQLDPKHGDKTCAACDQFLLCRVAEVLPDSAAADHEDGDE